MGGKVKTNHEKGSVAPLPHKRKVRLLLWGGASTPSDNFTFEHAKNNLLRDYKSADKNNFVLIDKRLYVATEIVAVINAQEAGSIRSLDIWTHGGPQALYLTTAAPPPPKSASWLSRKLYEANRWGFHNSSLYRTRTRMVFNAAGWTEGSALVNDIDFSRFAANAKIEFHGCKTAENPQDEDNIAADFSARLSETGKAQSSVIGHIENAQPLIKGEGKGETKATEQDYRYGERAVFKNGKLVTTTKQRGGISESELEK
jgi:hypothetical protein